MSGAGSLRLEGVGKRFGTVAALSDFSLDFQPGAITTLLGPSGCGKTTALRIIAGFLNPDSGDVLLDGRSLRPLLPFKRDTAMVFQDFALFPHMSVAQNVGYGLRYRGVTGQTARVRVFEMLEFLQLTPLAERMPHELSGGQQQRVALGRALAVKPRVLLMDEPLSNLDARLRVRLRSEIRTIQRELGVTTLFVTHDQEEALTLSDRIAVMSEGRLVQAGTPRELFELPNSRFVADVLGDANFLPVTAVSGSGDSLVASVLGQQVRVRSAAGDTRAGDQLLVRPDWWQAGEPQPGGLSLHARVDRVDYHGSFERLWLRQEGLPGLLQFDRPVAAGSELTLGETLKLSLAPGRGVLLAAAD